MCNYNANVASSLDKPDLARAWRLAALVILQAVANSSTSQNLQLTYQMPDMNPSWPLHPFGQNLIHSL